MNSQKAYQILQAWAKRVGSDLPRAEAPAKRAENFCRAVAAVRLGASVSPEEADARAVRRVMLDHLEAAGSQAEAGMSEALWIAESMEAMVSAFASDLVAATENQSYSGCRAAGPSRRRS